MPRKFWDVDHPPTVLLVGADERTADLERALRSRTDLRVERAERAEEALERLEERPAVECLWVPGELPDASGLELVEAAAERDPATAVLFVPAEGSETLAARATAAGASGYVSAAATVERRVERVEAAVDRALDRRHDAEKRSVLDAMLAEMEVPMYAKDERARHVLFSDAVGALDPDRLFGKTDLEAYPDSGEEIEESYRDDLAVVEGDRRIVRELEPYPANDEWMWTTKVPWTDDDGRIRGLVGMTLDVTEFKRRERALIRHVARLQEVPDYVEHDLRNPLGVAQGYLELAREGEESALDEVEAALERMEDLLEDFHSLATREVATGDAQRPLQLRSVVEDVWEYVAADGATLQVDVPPDAWLVADGSYLRPLLKNLLGNAVEHAGPAVTVRVGLLEDGFVVEDDGPGIPPAEREEVFEHGYTTAADGTGLGLAIVQDGAHRHGWRVSIADGTLGGARFEVTGCLLGSPLDAAPTGERVALTDDVDVGDVDVPGSTRGGDGSYVVAGAGDNIWGYINEFRFRHALVDGDVRIQGRVADLERAAEWSKAGLMVRSSLDPDAAYGFFGKVAGRFPEVGWRTEPGVAGRNHQLDGLGEDYAWFRIDRVGDQVACSLSADGERWQFVDRETVALGPEVAVGLAVCSTVGGEAIEARFEDVEVVRLDG